MIYPVPVLKGLVPQVSSGFGAPRAGGARTHQGVDIMFRRPEGGKFFTPPGTTAIAADDGVVKYAEPRTTGLNVRIMHPNGFDTLYIHMTKLFVKKGQTVKAGQKLGIIGDDPSNPNDPPHLHFEIRKRDGGAGTPQDPAPIIKNWRKIGLIAGGSTLLILLGLGAYLFFFRKR